MQLQHQAYHSKRNKANVNLVIPELSSPANLGSIYRIADAFDINNIFCTEPVLMLSKSNRFKRTARNTERFIKTELFESTTHLLQQLTNEGCQLIALELTDDSLSIQKFNFQLKPITIIIGDEKNGISEEILALVNQKLHIDMYGQNSSLNVAQSLGICLYEISRQLNG